jgi:HSP20 family protein
MNLILWRRQTALRPLWGDVESLFDRFLNDFGMLRPMWHADWRWPSLDMYSEDSQLVIKAEVPGLSKDDVEVTATDGVITISGETKSDSETKEGDFYRRERHLGSFRRVIPLPEGAKADEAKATFADGILEIRVPMAEAAKPVGTKITIE